MKKQKKAIIQIKKLNYGGLFNESGKDSYEILIGKKASLFRYRGTGWFWSVFGLGLSRLERRVFNHPFLKPQPTINIYLGKIGLSIEQVGNDTRLCGYTYWIMPLRYWLSYQIKRKWNGGIKVWVRRWINAYLHSFYHTKMVFVVDRYYESPVPIRTDLLTAYQLASNYEADLYLKGAGLIFSPLGLDAETNNRLVRRYLGSPFRFGRLFGYANYSDVEILDDFNTAV